MNKVSIHNSTSTPLVASNFYGQYEDVSNYSEIDIFLDASNDCQLYISWSVDGITDINFNSYNFEHISNNRRNFSVKPQSRFVKVSIINNSNMTMLNLQTIFKQNANPNNLPVNYILFNNIETTGASNTIDLSLSTGKQMTFYGNANGATNLTVQYSHENYNFYNSQSVYKITGQNGGDFGFTISASAPYVRLYSSAETTISAFLSVV